MTMKFEFQEFEDFVAHQQSRKAKSTWMNKQSGIKKLEKFLLERDLDLEDVSARNLRSFLTWMVNNEVSNQTAYEYMTAVRQFYDWYLIEESRDNPARAVDTDWIDKKETEHTKITLNQEEVSALVESAQSFRGKAMLALMASTGIRRLECCQAKIDNLDLDERSLEIMTVKTDFGKRTVYFDRRTRRILKEYITGGYRDKYANNDSEYIFVSADYGQYEGEGHISVDRLTQDFNSAVENCDEIQDKVEYEEMEGKGKRCTVTSHILRRSFSQFWVDSENGKPSGDIMSLKNHQGWENLETAKDYLEDTVERETRDQFGLSL